MTEHPDSAEELKDTDLETACTGGLLLPAVQSAREGGGCKVKERPKVWPWHFW